MGRRKIDTNTVIKDQYRRDVTFSKRKRGAIKKLIELSSLCKIDILCVMFDKDKQKLIQYRSNPNFKVSLCNAMLNKDIRNHFAFQSYTNQDLHKFMVHQPGKNDENDGEKKTGYIAQNCKEETSSYHSSKASQKSNQDGYSEFEFDDD